MSMGMELDIDALLRDCSHVLWTHNLQEAFIHKCLIINADVTCQFSQHSIPLLIRKPPFFFHALNIGPGASATILGAKILWFQPAKLPSGGDNTVTPLP